jgi:hypothetical protein
MDAYRPPRGRLYQALSIGSCASDLLCRNQLARVIGIGSRGVFIRSADRWILFISRESYRGPLTINLGEREDLLRKICNGMPVQLSPEQLSFPEVDLTVFVRGTSVWRSTEPRARPSPETNRCERLTSVARRILEGQAAASIACADQGAPRAGLDQGFASGGCFNRGTGLAPLLPLILGLPESQNLSFANLSPFQVEMQQLFTDWRASANPDLIDLLSGFLGRGIGLTPSGDDFVLGYLLALNRWRQFLSSGQDLARLDVTIIDAAYRKTTTLSANLIECAARGQADERLIAAVDWLVSGAAPDQGVMNEMLSWGHSSGIDVFAGFAAAESLRIDASRM